MPYATRDDVYQLALTGQAFVAYARSIEDFDVATSTIFLRAHGFSTDDVLMFEVTDGGRFPTGIIPLTLYYPVNILSADLFQVSATKGGAPLGESTIVPSGWSVTADANRRLAAHLVESAARIDECLTAHDPPIKPDPTTGKYPPVLVGVNARMAARAALNSLQFDNAQYRVCRDRLDAMEEFDNGMLTAWKAGKPVQPRPTDQNVTADNSARAQSARRPIPWNPGVI